MCWMLKDFLPSYYQADDPAPDQSCCLKSQHFRCVPLILVVPVAARDPGLFPYPVVSKQHRTIWPNLAGWNHAIEGWGANIPLVCFSSGWFGCKSVGQVVSTPYFRSWFPRCCEISISKSWGHMIQFDPIWNLSKTLSKRGWQHFFPQQPSPVIRWLKLPHLSPPFFSDLPAELQHIERRNFVGTQLEKAAEDANLEAIQPRVSFCHDWSTYLPGKPAEKRKKQRLIRST